MTPTRCTRLPSASIFVFAIALGTAACSSGSDETGGAGNGPGGSGPGGSGPAGSGPGGSPAGSGGSTGGAGTTGIAGGPAGTTGNAGSGPAGSGGAPAGTAGSTAGAGGSTGVGGATAGRGGSSAGGATAGRGGSAAGGSGVGGATAGRGGSAAGGAPAGGSTGTTGCPSNATFCSGFEDAALPTGAIYKVNAGPGEWTRDFAVDTAVKHAGSSSLRVKKMDDSGTSGSMYRMLAVPATPSAFWTRFWLRSDGDLGGEHNPFTMACPDDTPDKNNCVEFAEDVGIAFNTNDAVVWPAGFGRLTSGGTKPYVLPKDTWYCVEVSFDGPGRVQKLYINGEQLINGTSYPGTALTFKNFKFGFFNIHGPDKHLWYDDMAVAPTRIGGCPTP